jgi:hypothetical protein
MARLNILKLPRVLASVPREPEPAPVVIPKPLCFGCTWSHMIEGNYGEIYVVCGFNGVLRELPFPVARCTDYRERSAQKSNRVGFGAGV